MADTDDTAGFMEKLNADLYEGGSPVVDAPVPAVALVAPQSVASSSPPVIPGSSPGAQVIETPATPAVPSAEDDGEVAGRFRLKGPDAVFAQLRKDGVDADEAHARAYGPAKTDTPAAIPAAVVEPVKTTLETELAEVNAKLKEAADDSSFYNSDIDALQARRAELVADIKIQKAEESKAKVSQEQQQQETAAKAEADAWDAEFNEAAEIYPDAVKVGTSLYEALNSEITARENPDHPKHGQRISPMEFVPSHAARLRIAPVAKAPDAPANPNAPAAPQAAKAPGMSPVSGGARQTPPASPVSQPTADDQIKSAKTEDELQAALAKDLYGEAPAGALAFAF